MTNKWKCTDCSQLITGYNPTGCPVCGESVLEPTDDPSANQTGEERTEEFDVSKAIDRIGESDESTDQGNE